MSAEKTFRKLSEKGMFITSSDNVEETDVMLLKNLNDEILFRFKLIEGQDTLTSLKIRIDKFKSEVESCL